MWISGLKGLKHHFVKMYHTHCTSAIECIVVFIFPSFGTRISRDTLRSMSYDDYFAL